MNGVLWSTVCTPQEGKTVFLTEGIDINIIGRKHRSSSTFFKSSAEMWSGILHMSVRGCLANLLLQTQSTEMPNSLDNILLPSLDRSQQLPKCSTHLPHFQHNTGNIWLFKYAKRAAALGQRLLEIMYRLKSCYLLSQHSRRHHLMVTAWSRDHSDIFIPPILLQQ